MTKPVKNSLLSKRKIKQQFHQVIKTNNLFTKYIDSLSQKYDFDEQDLINARQLQEHFINLNLHFVYMSNTLK